MCVRDEARRDDDSRPDPLGDLQLAIFRPTERPAETGAIERPTRLLASGAGWNPRLVAACFVKRTSVEGAQSNALYQTRSANLVNRSSHQVGLGRFELDDEPCRLVTFEHGA